MNSPNVFKAITVWQPWAWLLALGIKPIENRPRYSHHRGPLLIHAGQKWDQQGALWILDKFPDLKDRVTQARNLCGGIVGKVNMIDCVKEHPSPWFVGKWGCVFAEPSTIDHIPYRGQQGWFNIPASVITGAIAAKPQNHNCDKTGLSQWCCNTDVRLVQRRSKVACGNWNNEFNGEKVYMCKSCRKANRGGFKFVQVKEAGR